MLAFILAPFYVLVNIFLVRWVLRWTSSCHRVFDTRAFRVLFIAVYTFAALSPLTSFLVTQPVGLHRFLMRVYGYWFGWLLYLILAVLLTEVVLGIVRRTRKKDFAAMQRVRQVQGSVALALLVLVGVHGMAQAERLHVTEYTAHIEKAGQELTVALLADLHLGYSTDPAYIERVAEAVRDMQPDLVVLAGDIFDNEFEAVPEPARITAALASMDSTFGTYACWGNHDLREPILAGFTWNSGGADKSDARMDAMLAEAGIRLLDDETVTLPGGVQLAGRRDPSRDEKLGETRKSPAELLGALDAAKPIFVIDHQPKELGAGRGGSRSRPVRPYA